MRKFIPLCLALALSVTALFPQQNADAATSDVFLNSISEHKTEIRHGHDKNEPYLKKEKDSILVNTSSKLNVYNVSSGSDISYKTSDDSIVKIKALDNNTCEYTGVKVGTATITVTVREPLFLFMNNTTNLKFKVAVTPEAVSVKFRKNKYKFEVGEKKIVRYNILPSISDEIPAFESLDKEIAVVNKNGRVTAKSAGTTYIKATINNGSSDKCKIIVE